MHRGRIPEILKNHEPAILDRWVGEQAAHASRHGVLKRSELEQQCRDFLRALAAGAQTDSLEDIRGPGWQATRDILNAISRQRALLGFTPSETAQFVFSLKSPIFEQLHLTFEQNPRELIDEYTSVNKMLDLFGLYTTEAYQKSREEVIKRQQQDLLELSTPVVKLWEGIVAMPLIGTLDSARAQTVMESLLESIVETNSAIAILDITGVPTVDTLVAQHLMKTITAARLMGAECIISGIRPQTAQTIVHLGVELADVTTKATLADAFALALKRLATERARQEVDEKHGIARV